MAGWSMVRQGATRQAIVRGALLLLCTVLCPPHAARAAAPEIITVDAAHPGSSLSSIAAGINTAVWDAHLQDDQIPRLLGQTPVSLIRFPGGSTSDTYHWQDNTITTGVSGYANPANNYVSVVENVARPAGLHMMITVNYGSNAAGTGGGDPAEAAAWVGDANVHHHFGIRYWEVGNELYGNGYYGASWETDLHRDHSPAAYGRNALAFIRAMKHADPSIKVGVVAVLPGDWPDGQGPEDWNSTVLPIAGPAADFVIVHWYAQQPGQESDAGLLSSPAGIPAAVAALRGLLRRYCGAAHAAQMGIMVTETNSVSSNPGKQTTGPVNALFLLEDYLTWLQAGVQNVDWWDLHNGSVAGNHDAALAGATTYGDYGVLATGDGSEPAANTPFPTFLALRLLTGVLTPGATFLPTAGSPPDVFAAALRRAGGHLSIVLVNTSPSRAHVLTVRLPGGGASNLGGALLTLDAPAGRLTSRRVAAHGGQVTLTLPPYMAAGLML